MVHERVASVLVAVLVSAGCASSPSSPERDRPVVFATTSVLADVTRNVSGDAVDVRTLVPRGADPHTFELSGRDIARLRDADLVVAVGLSFEEHLEDPIDAARADGLQVLEVGPSVSPLEGRHAHEEDAGEETTTPDPHFWLDPRRTARAATLISQAVAAIDGVDPEPVRGRTKAYVGEILSLDTELSELFRTVPPERRRLVTEHDALSYLAERYDLEIVASVLGLTTEQEPSAHVLAEVVEVMRESGVRVIVVAETASDRLARTIAAETQRDVRIVELFVESLGPPGSEAETYTEMMRTDATRLIEAMQ